MNNIAHLLIVPFESRFIIFNRTNGAISLLSPNELKEVKEDASGLALVKSFGDRAFKREEVCLQQENESFLITIELSTLCNLSCLYCYQDKTQTRDKIGERVINAILVYIEKVFLTSRQIKILSIGLIGGEPMLHMEVAFEIMEKVVLLCRKYNKMYSFHIDTNGTIPLGEIDKSFDNVKFSVSLSEQNDHNYLRGSLLFDSFQTIIENLNDLKNPKNKLTIRYNVNHNNIKDFQKFVEFVKGNITYAYNIDPMYTDNYAKNKLFTNKLSPKEFSKWNSTNAIDILIANKFVITGGISSALQLCVAYQPYSCKIHASGYVTLCDGMEYRELLHIEELSKNVKLLDKAYHKYKKYNPLNSEKCAICEKIIQCQGEIFCRKNYCEYQKRYNEAEFIKTYVKYALIGKENFFVGMRDEQI